jgi:hypothetical protein
MVELLILRPRRILPTLQALGLHPCLHGTMHVNYVPRSRFWNFTVAAPIHPENNHAQMSDIEREYKRTL